MTDISKLYPPWQFRIREAAENISTNSYFKTDAQIEALNARGKARSQGRDLHFVLEHIFGIPIATPSLNHNTYIVDGYCFSLKQESVPGEDETQPIHSATITGKKWEAAISFTLYVGKVVADPAFPDWPKRRAIVGRNIRLMNTNYSFLRANLAKALDELEAAYREAIPCYLAWKDLQLLPTDAAMRQDYFQQLIRQALRLMPTAELLSINLQPEPVEVTSADLEDAKVCEDGLMLAVVEKSEEATLDSLTARVSNVLARLDDILLPNDDPGDAPDEDDYEEDDESDDDDFDDDDESYADYESDDEDDEDSDFISQEHDPNFTGEDDEIDEETISPDLDDSTEPDTVTKAEPV